MRQNLKKRSNLIFDDREISWCKLKSLSRARHIEIDAICSKLRSSIAFTKEDILCQGQDGFKLDCRDPEIVNFLKGIDYKQVDIDAFLSDARLLYYFMSQIKALGDITYPKDSAAVRKHLFRMSDFLSGLTGEVLDVGCNVSDDSVALFPRNVVYAGCDPFIGSSSTRMIVSFAESLPFKENSFDACVFNTSLDHVFDYHEAISEAFRVTKPGGKIIYSGYVWWERAALFKDHVHFHHFRLGQLLSAFEEVGFVTNQRLYECPKKDSHRSALYMEVEVVK